MAQVFGQKFKNSLLWNYLNKVVGYAINLLLIIIIARGLGTYEFGVFSELLTLAALILIFCSLGFETTLNIYIPKHFDNPGQVSYLLRASFILVFLFSLILYLILLGFGKYVLEVLNNGQLVKYLNIIFVYVFFLNLATISEFILQSYYRTRILVLINLSIKVLLVAAVGILLKYELGISEVLYAYSSAYAIIAILSMVNLVVYVSPKPEKVQLRKIFKTGVSVWMTKFLNFFLGRYLDILLLGFFFVAKEEIGYYNIAFTLIMALTYLVTSGLSGIGLSAFSELESKNNIVAIRNGWLKILKGYLFFLVPIFLFSIFNAEIIINYLFGSQFEKSANLFQVLGFFFMFSLFLGSGLNVTTLYSIHKEKMVLYLRILIGVINLVLDIILIPKYGALGAVMATGVATIAIISLEFSLVKNILKFKYPFLFVVKLGVASIIALSISNFFITDGVLGLFTSILIFASGYVVTTRFLKISVYGYIRNYVLNYS